METTIASLLLILVTALAIRAHLRRTGAASGGATDPRSRRRCPRCGAAVASARARCGSCGAPQQAYEIVTAATANDDAGGDAAQARKHAVVRADVCVGCGTCVDACPEPDAIRLVNKQAVVDIDRCEGHGRCVEACPVGGILLTTGEAVQRVEVPLVDVNFQSNVPGLYIVGELGGRGLIKNAVNEGKLAVEHIARLARSDWQRPVAVAGCYDLVIVGSGPAGLSAALEARRLGLSYALLERGTLADSIRKYPRHKLLLAEPVRVPLYGDLWIADASKESLLKVWETVVETTGLQVRTGQEVRSISRDQELFRVETADRSYIARRVVLAMGRRGTPRRLGVPGEDLDKVLYDILEMEAFAGRKVLVVGGGDSAVESAVGLSRQKGADITLSYRGESFGRVKDRNRARLDEAVQRGGLRLLLNSRVVEIRPDAAIIDCSGRTSIIPNDDVIVRIGGEPPFEFLRRLGVSIVRKDIPIGGSAQEAHADAAM